RVHVGRQTRADDHRRIDVARFEGGRRLVENGRQIAQAPDQNGDAGGVHGKRHGSGTLEYEGWTPGEASWTAGMKAGLTRQGREVKSAPLRAMSRTRAMKVRT